MPIPLFVELLGLLFIILVIVACGIEVYKSYRYDSEPEKIWSESELSPSFEPIVNLAMWITGYALMASCMLLAP